MWLVLGWVTNDHVRVQLLVQVIYLSMWSDTQVNSAWPPLRG